MIVRGSRLVVAQRAIAQPSHGNPCKVRCRGHQWEAYRFIYCVLNKEIASSDHVIRHRCHNRKCVNPEHLVIGSQADNKRDEEEYWSYEIDPTTSERGVGEARTEPSPEPPVAGHQPGHFRAGRRPRGVRAVIGSRIGRVWLGW